MRRRIARILLLCIAVIPCSGCVWLQNEFFVWDAAAPPLEETSGTDVPR